MSAFDFFQLYFLFDGNLMKALATIFLLFDRVPFFSRRANTPIVPLRLPAPSNRDR